jgi:hypothetical protein
MEMGPFFAALEKMGMFAIAGYLVYNLVQQQQASTKLWQDFAERIANSMDRLVDAINRHNGNP